MGSNKQCFDYIKPVDKPTYVTVGNGEKVLVKGVGSVTLPCQIKKANKEMGRLIENRTFDNVLYVPGPMANLLSSKHLADKGITTIFNGKAPYDESLIRKGAAVNSKTGEIWFTPTSTSPNIYSVDIVTDTYLPNLVANLTYDELEVGEEEWPTVDDAEDSPRWPSDGEEENSDSEVLPSDPKERLERPYTPQIPSN